MVADCILLYLNYKHFRGHLEYFGFPGGVACLLLHPLYVALQLPSLYHMQIFNWRKKVMSDSGLANQLYIAIHILVLNAYIGP